VFTWFKNKKKQKDKLPARQKGNVCLNCDAILEGDENFCPKCGQRNNVNPLNFTIVLDEFFGNLFAYDSRLWNTLIPLLIKPGKTAYDFIYGKRKSLVNPFRIYLAISLVFFLVFGILSTFFSSIDDEEPLENPIQKMTAFQYEIYEGDQLLAYNDSLASVLASNPGIIKKMDVLKEFQRHNPPQSPAKALQSLRLEPTFWNRFVQKKVQNFEKIFQDDSQFAEKMFSGLSLTIFLILPLFALILKLLYVRRNYSYMEHLVFVFYTQSVFFLLLLLFTLAYFAFGHHKYFYFVFVLLFVIYLYIAMRRFYKQGRFKTFLKFCLANLSFFVLAFIGLFALMIISFIMY